MEQEQLHEKEYETGLWPNLKSGLQVGAGFFVGYFLMRFLTMAAMIVAGVMILMCVCVPQCEKYDRTIIAPIENKVLKTRIVNPRRVVWAEGCRVRAKPSNKSRVIGQVFPGRAYVVKRQRRGWININGFAVNGWVGCKAEPPGARGDQQWSK